ncbi:hypothetical protein ACFL5G_03510, partial [Candidatus Margulisiibacteriota bacterium]
MRVYLQRIVLILVVLLLFSSNLLASSYVIKTSYIGNPKLDMRTEGKFLGIKYWQNDEYTINNGYGIGVEYETSRVNKSFTFGLGVEYYLPRNVPKVEQSGAVLTYPVVPFSTDEDFSNAQIQVTYFTGKAKWYFTDTWFMGAQLRMPTVTLVGSDWEDWWGKARVAAGLSQGFVFGVDNDDFVFELVLGTDKLSFHGLEDPDGNSLEVEEDLSVTMFSIGRRFSLEPE